MTDHLKSHLYGEAQEDMRLINVAIHEILNGAPEEGLTNVKIGGALGALSG